MKTPPIRKITIQQNVRKSYGVRRISRTFFERMTAPLREKNDPPLKRLLSWGTYVVIPLLLAGSIAGLALIAWVASDLPDPNNIGNRAIPETTKIFDRTGEVVLYEVHGTEKRTVIDLEAMSPHVLHSTIAAEDKDFYEHKGFSLIGYARAFYTNLVTGERGQGGSTLTQQFVKNAVLSPEKTYTRKFKELVLSFELERRFTKDEILKLYLNEIPYGPVVYGIQSASESFFGKDAKDLSIAEAAMLTAVSNATTYYSPYGSHTDALMERTRWIIGKMFEEGYITEQERDEALADEPLTRLQPQNATIISPHFVFYVRDILAKEFGEQLVERGGLRVITTLDADYQEKAIAAVKDNIERVNERGGSTAALMAFDPKNGDILAMIGSADYFDDEINGKYNALLGRLQPGSSIKPMAYASAFEAGYTPDTVVYDVKTDFNGYSPNNYDLAEHGPVTFKEALARSLNIPAVKALYLGGLDRFVTFADKMGYTTLQDRDDFGLSVVLGGATVRPIEHFNAYGAFANDGMLAPVRGILSVQDKEGNMLFEIDEKKEVSKRVLEEQIARNINKIMSDNALRAPTFGESNYLTLGDRQVAAKTGTTNDYKDAWTIGYTPSLVTGVWVGNADGSVMGSRADGSVVAAPIWNQFMRNALTGRALETFVEPEPIVVDKPVLMGERSSQVRLRIDSITGKLATEYTPEELIEERGFGAPHSILFFVNKEDPRGPMPEHPENDPQFANWEQGVATWFANSGGAIPISTQPPPTEYDDVHIPENVPTVRVVRPESGQSIGDRTFFVEVDASANRSLRRATFSIDGDMFDELLYPFRGSITIPNRFGKGFHTLTATVFDDVGNRGSEDVRINLTADPLPLQVWWGSPSAYSALYRSGFPYDLKFAIDDVESIRSIELSAIDWQGAAIPIGTIEDPKLANMAMQWGTAPELAGDYDIKLTATLVGGERVTSQIPIYVR